MSEDEQPQPQFPAPNLTREEPAVELERLPDPSAAARKRIAAHLRKEHAISPFRLAELRGFRWRTALEPVTP